MQPVVAIVMAVAALLGSTSCGGPTHPGSDREVVGALGRELDDYLSRLAAFGYSGAVLVMQRGQVILRKGYGLADRRAGIANTPATVFDLGSLTKQFTAAAILRLEMEGKLTVTDPLSRHLPGVPPDKSGITLHQLLGHTAGMPSFRGGRIAELTRDRALERIFRAPLRFAPGSKYEYSNGGYAVLAAVIETASGRPYRDYLREALFEPAGMTQTGFWGSGLPAVPPSQVAHGYDDVGEVGDPRSWSATTWDGVGDAGVTSSVLDLARWHAALRGEKILSRDARRKLWTPATGDAPASDDYATSAYGYGWWVQRTSRGTRIQHGGDSIGFGAQLTWYPTEDLLVIGLCNIRHDLFPTNIQAARVIPDIVFGRAHASPPAFRAADPREADRLVGTYQLASGGRLVVRRADGQLQIGADGQDAADLLIPGAPDALRQRAELSTRARAVFAGAVAGDFSEMAAALPPGEDIGFWRDGWPDEMTQFAGPRGAFESLDVLGTTPAGQPGHLDTIVRFRFASGAAAYEVRWRGSVFVGSSVESPTLAAVLHLAGARDGGFVGWNIVFWDQPAEPFYVALEPSGIVVRRGTERWSARRM